MNIHYCGKMSLMAFGMAMLLAGCAGVGVKIEKKYDSPQDYNKVFTGNPHNNPHNQIMNFVYYEAKLKPWAFWNIFYHVSPSQSVWEAEMLVTPAWLHTYDMDWYISKEDEEYFKDYVLKDRLANWFAPDSENYEVWSPALLEFKRPLIFVDKRTRADSMIHIFIRNHVCRDRTLHLARLGAK